MFGGAVTCQRKTRMLPPSDGCCKSGVVFGNGSAFRSRSGFAPANALRASTMEGCAKSIKLEGTELMIDRVREESKWRRSSDSYSKVFT
jgi:hypothetical protein